MAMGQQSALLIWLNGQTVMPFYETDVWLKSLPTLLLLPLLWLCFVVLAGRNGRTFIVIRFARK